MSKSKTKVKINEIGRILLILSANQASIAINLTKKQIHLFTVPDFLR